MSASRWRHIAVPAGLFLLALLVRASPWREVLVAGRVVPPANDAFYHLRRIVARVYGGGSLAFDPYLAFPAGAKPIWPPAFDALCAWLLAPFVPALEHGGQARLEALAVWIPPLLGALTVVLTFALVRRHWGERAAWISGLLLCVLSGHFWYSQVGYLDHHAAVAAIAVALLGSALRLVAAAAAEDDAARLRAALGVGAFSGAALLIWPGSLLHVSLVHAGLLAHLLTRSDPDGARRQAVALAGAHGLAFAIVAPSGLSATWPQWGALSPVVLSRFQPLLFGLAAITLGCCAWLWRGAAGADRGRRAAGLLALVAGAVAVAGALLPGLVDGAGDAWRWIAKRESFQSRVSESQPLLEDRGVFSLRIAAARLSGFVFLLVPGSLWLLWCERRRPTFWPALLCVGFALGLLAVTLVQKRFFNTASVGLAIVVGVVAADLWRRARDRRGARALQASGVALAVLCVLPTLEPYTRHVENAWRALRGEKPVVTGVFLRQMAALETADWLREHTPPTRGWLDPTQRPEYGVLAPWPLGHAIAYVGRRPTLVDNFGDDLGADSFAFVERYYAQPESTAGVAAAAARGVRYVVVQSGGGEPARESRSDALLPALYHRDGSGDADRPAVVRHRLVFESRSLGNASEEPPLFKVFERVAGARIEGRAAPGAGIALRVGVTTNRGRRFQYTAHVRADPEGRYAFRVPYANGEQGAVRVAPLYRLSCGDAVGGLAIGEDAVVRGSPVTGPALCVDPPRGAAAGAASIAPEPHHAIGTS